MINLYEPSQDSWNLGESSEPGRSVSFLESRGFRRPQRVMCLFCRWPPWIVGLSVGCHVTNLRGVSCYRPQTVPCRGASNSWSQDRCLCLPNTMLAVVVPLFPWVDVQKTSRRRGAISLVLKRPSLLPQPLSHIVPQCHLTAGQSMLCLYPDGLTPLASAETRKFGPVVMQLSRYPEVAEELGFRASATVDVSWLGRLIPQTTSWSSPLKSRGIGLPCQSPVGSSPRISHTELYEHILQFAPWKDYLGCLGSYIGRLSVVPLHHPLRHLC
jgi:hypothetical protein